MEMEYQVICRSCLTTSATEYINMATPTSEGILLLEYFNFCTNLDANTTDNLPVTICTVCCHDLQIAFEFIQSSRQADTILKQNLVENPIQEQQQEIIQDAEQNVIVEDIIVESEGECENNANIIENFIQVKGQELSDGIVAETGFDNEIVPELENNFENSDNSQIVIEDSASEIDKNLDDNYLRMKIFSKLQLSENDGYLAKFVEECVRKTALENAKRKIKEDKAKEKDFIQLVYPDGKCPPRPGIKWKCKLCGRISKELSVYESHVNWHKGEKPYQCQLCCSQFRCKLTMERHIRSKHFKLKSETKNQFFQCNLCSLIFNGQEMLLKHKQSEHNTEINVV